MIYFFNSDYPRILFIQHRRFFFVFVVAYCPMDYNMLPPKTTPLPSMPLPKHIVAHPLTLLNFVHLNFLFLFIRRIP